jgi:hypothetical protein
VPPTSVLQKKHTINIIEDEEGIASVANNVEQVQAEASVAKGAETEALVANNLEETEASVANNVEQEQAEASVAKGAETEASVGNNPEETEALVAKDPAETEALVAKDTEEDAETEALAANEPKKGNLVMVKQSTIYWPALIMDTTPTGFEVQVLNNKNTIKYVSKEDVKPFTMDDSQTKGREKVICMSSDQSNICPQGWKAAYAKAVLLYMDGTPTPSTDQ